MTQLRVDVYVGDSGIKLYHDVIDRRTGLPADLSAGLVTLRMIKPDGVEVAVRAGFETDGTDGRIYWIPAPGFLDRPGRWHIETLLITAATRQTFDSYALFVGRSIVIDEYAPSSEATILLLDSHVVDLVADTPLLVTSTTLTLVYGAVVQRPVGDVWERVTASVIVEPALRRVTVEVAEDITGARVVLFGTTGAVVGLDGRTAELVSFVPVEDDTVRVECSTLSPVDEVSVQRETSAGVWEVVEVGVELGPDYADLTFGDDIPSGLNWRVVFFGQPAAE